MMIISFSWKMWSFIFLSRISVVLSQVQAVEETQVDTHEGSTVWLHCRFPPVLQNATCFWLSHINNNLDNAAVENKPLSFQYRVSMNLSEGLYDLQIRNVTYELNNGKYECRVKVSESGVNLYHKNITLTVLRPPGPPSITPMSALATEGRSLKLHCNTEGGSPEPEVRWYRENDKNVLFNQRTLELIPTREDDGAIYRCVVRNRAMPEGQTLNASIQLSVEYSPHVKVGPENPFKVEANDRAVLKCDVDSKPRVSEVRWMKDDRFIATTFDHIIHRVTIHDAGNYSCSATNHINQPGKAFLTVDVLYPPVVTIEGETIRDIEVEDTVIVHCNFSANPQPFLIEWTREGRPEFRHSGSLLRLNRVNADSAGNYTCTVVNTIHPTGGKPKNHSAQANVIVRVRHKPGPAKITPDSPVAIENSRVTLNCMSNPPGYPEPQYQWRKEDGGNSIPVGLDGPKLVISSVQLSSDGTYKCLALNEIGTGEPAYVRLTVHQRPKLLTKLQPHLTKKVGESSFSVTCSAYGKPQPNVTWLKDDERLSTDENLYKVNTVITQINGNLSAVNSTLIFFGQDRPQQDKIMANDRGKYTCVFANEVNSVESQMILTVEHPPIVLHKHTKVAYSLREIAEITCKVQAWPKPEFFWSLGNNAAPLQGASNNGHYEISTTNENDLVYTSVLKVIDIRENDYDNYICRVKNAQGTVASAITLQPKSEPDKPTDLSAVNIGPDYVTLKWEIGFNGGLDITKYFVSFRRIPRDEDNNLVPDCSLPSIPSGQWSERDCERNNPCNITHLEQNQKYTFKVKAYNTKNHSEYSDEKTFSTTVATIPPPKNVNYEPESGKVALRVGPSCLALTAHIESTKGASNDPWIIVDEWPLDIIGSLVIDIERSFTNLIAASSEQPGLRVKLCLTSDKFKCSSWTEAKFGLSAIAQAGSFSTSTLIALIVSGAVFLLFAVLLFIFYGCRRKHAAKAKDYEMDSNAVRPSLVTGNGQQTQAPPPYYSENKALEHSLDRALAMEDSKSPAYAQSGYGWVQPNHNVNGENGVNMGYLDNSYSNSNNGGSVNSQDSIWQMKSAAANGTNPPYDLGGYAATESDYPTHPHYMPQREDYRESHNLSRQQFCPEPFATVVKSQKHADSPYDVSGLPYQEAYDEDTKPPQQVSLSYDESLESGYSTPNGRRPRIIREIIV